VADSFKQVIEIALQQTTDPGIRTLLTTLRDLGDSGDVTADQLSGLEDAVGKLATELKQVGDAAAKADQFEKLVGELAETETKLSEASKAALALKLELGTIEKPTKAMQRAFADARKEVDLLEAKQRQQYATLQTLDDALSSAGVDTSRLATEQARLRAESERTVAALRTQADAVRAQAQANRDLRARLDEQDAAFRRQTQANRASAEALAAYRDRAAQAKTETKGLGDQANATAGVMQRLRGVFAAVLGFITLRGAVEGIKNLVGLGDAAESARIRLAGLYGSQEAGNRAFAELKQLARDNAQQFDAVLDAATKLKTFGLDPLDGTLQSLIDQNAKMGGSQQSLEGIILAVGQAWAKQKLQGEEILQLVERGVPVWDLLATATGKNVQELQKLSEQGKLGRTEIKLLLDEIGRAADGAAAKNLGLISSLVLALKEEVKDFFQLVNQSGALTFFKERLAAIRAEIAQLAADGRLAAYAVKVSDAIITVAKAVESSLRFVVQYSGALYELAKAFVAIKVATFLVGMASATKAMLDAGIAARATAASMGGLRGAMAAIPASVKIAVAAVGLELAISQWKQLYDDIKASEEIEGEANKRRVETAETLRVLEARMQTILSLQAAYKDTVIQTKAAVEEAGATDLRVYAERLEGARQYYAALARERRKANDDAGEAEARARLADYSAAIDIVIARLRALDEAKNKSLSAPTNELGQALLDLGVDAETAGVKITKEGEKIISLFNRVAIDADAKSGQIRAAFSKALDSSTTVSEVQKLEQALRVAFESGKLSATEYAVEVGKAAAKVVEISEASKKAQGAFTGIGDAANAAAKKAIQDLEAVRSTLVAVAQEINDKLTAAINQDADSSVIADLTAQAKEADVNLQAVNKQITEAKAGLQSTGEQGKQTFAELETSAAKAGDAAEAVGEQAAAGTNTLGTAIGGVLGQLVAMFQKFSAISPLAAEFFKESYNSSVRLSHSLADVAESIARAERATDAAIANQRAAAEAMRQDFERVAEAGEGAGLAFLNASRAGVEGLQQMAEQARQGRGQLELLNQAELDTLAASADRAAQRIASIEAAAKSASDQLAALARQQLDALDQRAGNQAAVLERQFQDQLRQIEELERQAGDSGRTRAEEARRLAERNYREQLAQIEGESDARIRAAEKQADAIIANAEREKTETDRINRGSGGGSTSGPTGAQRKIEIVVIIRNEQTGAAQFIELAQLPEVRELITEIVLQEIRRGGGGI
jgi:tape measure domain-containing protein